MLFSAISCVLFFFFPFYITWTCLFRSHLCLSSEYQRTRELELNYGFPIRSHPPSRPRNWAPVISSGTASKTDCYTSRVKWIVNKTVCDEKPNRDTALPQRLALYTAPQLCLSHHSLNTWTPSLRLIALVGIHTSNFQPIQDVNHTVRKF
jgi:hypothetical protein